MGLGPTAASGAEPARRFTLNYHAAASCPSDSELVRQIVLRTPLATRVERAPSDVDARVEIHPSQAGMRGSVDFDTAQGAVHREVDGASCGEVARAIALILALAIDPDADTSPLPPEPKPVRETSRTKASPSTPAAASSPTTHASTRSNRSTVWFGAGGLFGLTGGVAPSPTFYDGLFIELGQARKSMLMPSLRVSALRASDAVVTEAGGAELSWMSARLAGCPLHFGSTFFAEPCATFDYGRLSGQGFATSRPKSSTATWYGPGAALHAGALVFDLLTLGVDFGFVVPLARDRFFFRPDVTAHRIPPIAGYAGLAIGVRFGGLAQTSGTP